MEKMENMSIKLRDSLGVKTSGSQGKEEGE
jgi:hypothetical protein